MAYRWSGVCASNARVNLRYAGPALALVWPTLLPLLALSVLQMHLDVFKEDPEFKQHEEEYAAIRREILGEVRGRFVRQSNG